MDSGIIGCKGVLVGDPRPQQGPSETPLLTWHLKQDRGCIWAADPPPSPTPAPRPWQQHRAVHQCASFLCPAMRGPRLQSCPAPRPSAHFLLVPRFPVVELHTCRSVTASPLQLPEVCWTRSWATCWLSLYHCFVSFFLTNLVSCSRPTGMAECTPRALGLQ